MKAIERLYKYLEFKGIKPTVFERDSGISSGYLSKQFNRKADIGESILVLITENCPEINPLWLLLGQGEMLDSNQSSASVIQPMSDTLLYNMYKEEKTENKALIEQIGQLKERLRIQEEKIVGLQTIIASSSEDAQDADIAAVG